MKKEVQLSVIMPVFNAEAYLEAAVKSVISQTLEDIEIICVDDCSTDGSLDILKRLSTEDDRILVIHSEKNVGAGKARNIGIETAKGKFITFMDSDDIIEPDLYAKAYERTQGGLIDEVVWGLTEEHYDKKGSFKRSVTILPESVYCDEADKLIETVLHLERDTLFGYQWNSLYKASVIFENNLRFTDSLFYEDYFFNLKFIGCAKTLVTLKIAGYHYYKRVNGSITNSFSGDYFNLSFKRVKTMYDFCVSRNYINSEMYEILGNKLLRYTLSALSRNNNKLSKMNQKEQKQWFYDICELPLYSQILPDSGKQNIAFSLLRRSILKKRAGLALLMGKLCFLLKK